MDTTFDYLCRSADHDASGGFSQRGGNRPEAAAAEPSQTAVEAEAETNVPNEEEEEEEEENESDTISELRAMLEAGEISKDDFDEALAELKGEAAPTSIRSPRSQVMQRRQ